MEFEVARCRPMLTADFFAYLDRRIGGGGVGASGAWSVLGWEGRFGCSMWEQRRVRGCPARQAGAAHGGSPLHTRPTAAPCTSHPTSPLPARPGAVCQRA